MFGLCLSTLGYVGYFTYGYVNGVCTVMLANEIKLKMSYLKKDFCNKT